MSTNVDGAVVVGVAESVLQGWALRWAAEQAQLEGRALALVHASGSVSAAWRDYGMDAVPSQPPDPRPGGAELLDRARAVVERAAPDLEVRQLFEVADPSTLLVRLSTTAHLVVLGSRGRGPVRGHLLGSVGLATVRHAGCPVVVHRPGDHPGLVHRGVLVAGDATEESLPVLAFAFRQASLRALPLTVVHYASHVRSALVAAPVTGSPGEEAEQDARALSESLAGFREEYPDVHLTVETVPDRGPARGMTKRTRAADLAVVGTHQRGVLGRIASGSVSESVLQHARGPVAVVPPSRASHEPAGE